MNGETYDPHYRGNVGKLAVINGSYRKDGTTVKCLRSVMENMERKYGLEHVWIEIPDDLVACTNCGPGNCIKGCYMDDMFIDIAHSFKGADRVLIGSPVYLDFPTPKLLALLSRFNSFAEPTGRKFFAGIRAHIHTNGYCSGTKAAAKVIMSACEMLGMTAEGRSTTEYVELWKDDKIRGGMNPEEIIRIKE